MCLTFIGKADNRRTILFSSVPWLTDRENVRIGFRGWRYEHAATLNTFWKDLYRPELFWRTFRPVGRFDPDWEAIQIFRRKGHDSE